MRVNDLYQIVSGGNNDIEPQLFNLEVAWHGRH